MEFYDKNKATVKHAIEVTISDKGRNEHSISFKPAQKYHHFSMTGLKDGKEAGNLFFTEKEYFLDEVYNSLTKEGYEIERLAGHECEEWDRFLATVGFYLDLLANPALQRCYT